MTTGGAMLSIGIELTQYCDSARYTAASDVYAPVSGEVVAVNKDLEGDPALINRDAEAGAWFMKVKLKDKAELNDLMDKSAYDAFVAEK